MDLVVEQFLPVSDSAHSGSAMATKSDIFIDRQATLFHEVSLLCASCTQNESHSYVLTNELSLLQKAEILNSTMHAVHCPFFMSHTVMIAHFSTVARPETICVHFIVSAASLPLLHCSSLPGLT